MADTNKKEYNSNLHPKGDLDTTVYPNVKSENIIDKDTTAYTAGKVPDSSLVSKSLDGLNEKIETNKIQTDTNKTNIATLQGQVASNTQNVENLSAVMPTDINVDANGYAILEHDGTEITGQNKKLQVVESNFKGKIIQKNRVEPDYNHFEYDFFEGNRFYPYIKYESREDISRKGDTQTTIVFQSTKNNNYHGPALFQISFKDRYKYSSGIQSLLEFYLKTYNSSKNEYENYTYMFPDKEGTIALVEDLDTKQGKRFVHTVEIHYASNGSYFCFTGTSDKNTPIDSVVKLTTVFTNRDLCGTGIFGSAGLSKIHVGSSINDTTFKKYMTNGEYVTPSEETFAMVFNTTGFTITDSVSAL